MKRLNLIFVLTLLLMLPKLAISVTNPKWVSPLITSVPVTNLAVGTHVKFYARFKVEQGHIERLQVIVRLDGTKVVEENYTDLIQNFGDKIEYNWTATPGDHVIKFRIDPHNRSGDADPSDNSNLLKLSFNVDPNAKPDLELTMYSLPKSPQVGDMVGVTGHVKNIGNADSKACNLRFKSGDHYYPEIYPVPLIIPGRHFEITIRKELSRPRTYTMGAELWNSTDPNQSNNKASLDITPRAPDLIITKWEARQDKVVLGNPAYVRIWVKNIGSAEAGPFNVNVYITACKGIAQGPIWRRVEQRLKPEEEAMVEISHKLECFGDKRLTEMVVDMNNEVFESNEDNNTNKCHKVFKVVAAL